MSKEEYIRAYVLTIDEPEGARRQSAKSQLKRLGCDFEFVAGAKCSDEALKAVYSPLLNRLLLKRSLAPSEIAIYEGHRRIWRRICENQDEFALVVEDDVHFPDPETVQAAIADVLRNPREWDILKLFDFRPKPIIVRRKCGSTLIAAYKYPASGAVAYLIKRSAAENLLKRARIFRPVDEDFSHCWEFDLRVWSVVPNLAEEISYALGGSLTEESRQRVKRSPLRSVWGNVLQAHKLVRSLVYNRKIRANVSDSSR